MDDSKTDATLQESKQSNFETLACEVKQAVHLLSSCAAEQGRMQQMALLQMQLAAQQKKTLQELESRLLAVCNEEAVESACHASRRFVSVRSSSSLTTGQSLDKSDICVTVNDDEDDGGDAVVFQLDGLRQSPMARNSLSRSVLLRSEQTKGVVMQEILHVLARAMRHVESIREPQRHGCLAELVKSSCFNTLCMVVITLNAAFITLSTDRELANPGQDAAQYVTLIELAFSAFYVIELTAKLIVHRMYFFCNKDMKWNIFDFLLVLTSMLETALTFAVSSDGGGVNFTFLRMLRLCKIGKVLRIFRTLEFFTDLRLMAECVAGSLINAFWCMSLLFFVIFIFALLICQGLAGYLAEQISSGQVLNESQTSQLAEFYSSVSQTMITLLQSTTAGLDWRDCFLPLRSTGTALAATYIFFILMFTVSVWNIVTSVFVEKAMKIAKPDMEAIVMEQGIQDQREARHLTELFAGRALADDELAGSMGLEELRALAENAKFRAYLNARGIDIKNVEVFFKMLTSASGQNEVNIHVLANACVRMKGFATSIDLQSLSFEAKINNRKHAVSLREFGKKLSRIERLLQEPGSWAVEPRWSQYSMGSAATSEQPKLPPEDDEHSPELSL
eukprot:TRINITY_DN8859_c0_g1_i11.p1 TRINITY_DN8859_c0_g1~~TRINITY_DN8859_c0_g1_i11.p1  ORF type:complete len:620 (-),score=125.26 TRINITY_DN8859_c0_g1_i11:199-2058(-)